MPANPTATAFVLPRSVFVLLLAVLILETDSGGSVGADGGDCGSNKGGSGSEGSSGRVC